MKSNHALSAALTVSCALLSSSCAVFPEYELSVAVDLPAGAHGENSDGLLQMRLPQATIAVEFQNYHETGNTVMMPLFLPLLLPFYDAPGADATSLNVWIDITPVDRQDGFTFVPRRVAVTADGARVEPTAVIGPRKSWRSPRAVAAGCGARRYGSGIAVSRVDFEREETKSPDVPLPFEGPSCFLLNYATSPSPDRAFVLSIQGVEHADRPISVPDITYRKGSIVKLMSAP